jgi:hypothetical protein
MAASGSRRKTRQKARSDPREEDKFMDKKQDRRAEKPREQGSGTYDPNRPEPGRKIPEAPGDKGFGKPEGQPVDKQMPKPEVPAGRRDILESERSDRDSGRPIQLDDEAEEELESIPQQARREEQKPPAAGKPKH